MIDVECLTTWAFCWKPAKVFCVSHLLEQLIMLYIRIRTFSPIPTAFQSKGNINTYVPFLVAKFASEQEKLKYVMQFHEAFEM